MLTVNKTVITTDKISKVIFSFFRRKAIQEILIELITMSSIEIIINVVLIKLKSGYLFNTEENEASTKKMIIVLK